MEEIGADAWSPVNYYIQELQQELGIELGNDTYVGNGQVGIWSSDGFVAYKKIALQNIDTDACLAVTIKEFIASLTVNYVEREKKGPFETVNEFLSSGNMTGYSLTEFELYLQSECNATQEYMDTLVAPIVRAIYDQPLNLTSFAGEVSLLAIFTPPLWSATGNSQLPKSLLANSDATVHLSTQIETISWNGEEYTLYYQGRNMTSEYVVIAAPIEFTNITFQNVDFYESINNRDFVHCYVTHVQATGINPVYFGMEAGEEAPDSILTTPDSTLPFTIIGIEDPSLTVEGAKIYKIFSNTDVSSLLSQMFIDVSDFHVHHWDYTFPHLIETSDFQPILLAPNMFYLNTMESTVTAMEGSVISGRNIAQLLYQEIYV